MGISSIDIDASIKAEALRQSSGISTSARGALRREHSKSTATHHGASRRDRCAWRAAGNQSRYRHRLSGGWRLAAEQNEGLERNAHENNARTLSIAGEEEGSKSRANARLELRPQSSSTCAEPLRRVASGDCRRGSAPGRLLTAANLRNIRAFSDAASLHRAHFGKFR